MTDLSWLSSEAHQIHDIFYGFFFLFATTLLLLGVVGEYFRLPLTGQANFATLIVRVLIATLLLIAYPDIINFIADFSDSLADRIGGLNTLNNISEKTKEVLKKQSWSWTNMRNSLLWIISYLVYSVLYLTIFIYDAIVVYGWTVLYIFSPILILLFILPQTSGATVLLFRSHIELASYKIVWSVLGTLLWSTALQNLDPGVGDKPNFFVVLGFMVIVAFSIIFTPKIVGALINAGMSNASSQMGAIGFGSLSAGAIGPGGLTKVMQKPVTVPYNQGVKVTKSGFDRASKTAQMKYSQFLKSRKTSQILPKNVVDFNKYKNNKDSDPKPPTPPKSPA